MSSLILFEVQIQMKGKVEVVVENEVGENGVVEMKVEVEVVVENV